MQRYLSLSSEQFIEMQSSVHLSLIALLNRRRPLGGSRFEYGVLLFLSRPWTEGRCQSPSPTRLPRLCARIPQAYSTLKLHSGR